MHPLKKIVAVRATALLMVTIALWQQQAAKAGATEAMPNPEPWQAPLEAPLAMINPYFQPNSDYSAGHRGVDYRVDQLDTVFAPANSVVWFNGTVVNRRLITLRTSSGDLLEFEPVCSDLAVGSTVEAGQPIGQICSPSANYLSHCPGQLCMHFSLRTANGYLSPLVRYQSLSPTVLLPQF